MNTMRFEYLLVNGEVVRTFSKKVTRPEKEVEIVRGLFESCKERARQQGKEDALREYAFYAQSFEDPIQMKYEIDDPADASLLRDALKG